MKKILLLSLLCLTFGSVFAQYPGRPAFGKPPYGNATGSSITYGVSFLTDTGTVTAPDTLLVTPGSLNVGSFDQTYIVTLNDSCVIALNNIKSSFTGSHLHFIINCPARSGSVAWVKFLGWSKLASQWLVSASGTTKLSVTVGTSAEIDFICSGGAWCEVSRTIY